MTAELDGMIAAAVVSIDDGLLVERVSKKTDVHPGPAAAYLARVVQSNREAMRMLGWNQQPEDILITTEESYFIIRQLAGDLFFLFVLTTRDEWIGRTRALMAQYAKQITVILDLVKKKS